MKKNNKHTIPTLAVLAIILTAAACLLAVYLHLPAQRYKSALTLGKKYLNEMNFDEAELTFKKAIAIEPKQSDGYIGLAETYTAGGDHTRTSDPAASLAYYKKAEKVYQKLK